MGRIMAWTPSLTGGIVVVRDPCLHGRFSIGSLCVGPSDTMSWSPTIGLLITPQEPIQPRLGGRVERFPSTFRTEVVHRIVGTCRDQRLTLACVLDKDSNRALQQLLSVSNTCSGQVLDFSNTSSRPLSPFRLVSAGSKAPQQC